MKENNTPRNAKKISKAQIQHIRDAKARKSAARKKALEAKKNQKYNLMAMYDSKIVNNVKETVKNKKINTALVTDTFFIIKEVTATEAKAFFAMFDDCKVTTGTGSKTKEHRVIFQLHKVGETKTIGAPKRKKPRPGAHTSIPKVENTKFTERETPRTHKRRSILKRGKHNSGCNMTSTQRKLRSRIKKATNAIGKKETKTRSTNVIHKTIVKAKQLKLDFKEAA